MVALAVASLSLQSPPGRASEGPFHPAPLQSACHGVERTFLLPASNDHYLAMAWQQQGLSLADVAPSSVPDDWEQIRKFEMLISLEKFQEAEPLLRAYVISHPSSWKAYYFLGYTSFREQQLSESVKALAKSLQLNADDAEAHNLLGKCLSIAGVYDRATWEFHEALRLDPKFAEPHYNLGRIFAIQDDFSHARREFELAIEANPNYAQSYNALGFALEALGDDSQALEDYQKAIRLNEDRGGRFSAPYVNLSGYYNRRGQLDLAMQYAHKALDLEPQSDLAYFQIAKAYRARQDWTGVVEALEKAVQIRPASGYYYILGTAYRKLGRVKESEEAVEKFQTLEKQTGDLESKKREARRKEFGLEYRPEN